MRLKKEHIFFVILLLFFISWTILIYYFSPETIVNTIGIHNSYFIVFLTCIIGGISIMFPIPYYLEVFTFAAGGSNPFLLGISAGLGIAIGDSTSYLFGYNGGQIIPRVYQNISARISKIITSSPEWLRFVILIIWGSIFPFPNDLLIIPLGLIKYPYIKIVVPLVIGSIIFNTLIALAGFYGFNIFI